MSIIDPDYGHVTRAEMELEDVQKLGDQLHTLVVATAARVAADGGESRCLLHALDHVTTAERALWRGVKALIDDRAVKLSLAEGIGAAA